MRVRVKDVIFKMGREGMQWKGEMKGGVKKMEGVERWESERVGSETRRKFGS